MVSKIATLKDRNGNKLLPRTVFEAVQSNSGNTLDSALNQFISWKELTMNSDGTFPTTKCADWYSDKIYIEGQTVKNIANIGTDISTDYYKTINHNNNWALYDIPYIDLDRSKKYIIRYEVIENTLTVDFLLSSNVSINPVFGDYSFRIKKGETGIFEKEISPSLSNTDMLLRMQVYSNSGVGKIVLRCTITEEKLNAYIPFGLASLGDKKDGRTYISLESNGYENQIEIAEPLRKVGNVADTIDGNVLTRNIMQDTYTGKEDWRMVASQSDKYLRFNLTDIKIKPVGDIIGINCDLLEPQTFANIYNGTKEGISVQNVNTTLSVNINKTKLSTQDDTGFKAWLQANSVTVQYQLATPTVEQVKSTFVYTPNQNGECSFKFNNAVAPSNSKLSVAQTTQLLLNDKLDKTDVVNTKTETVLGKALDATQNNPNVDGSLAKQISALRGYTSPKLIDLSLSVTSNIVDIMTILGADGNLNGCYVEKASGNNYPATYGKITTLNNGNGRTIIYEAYLNAKKELYYAVVAYADSVTVTDWIKLSTSDEITALQSDIDKSGWSVEGSKKIIPNVLFIGDDYNTGKWGCVSGQTLNMPTGVEVGIRETLAYDNNNVTIRITENRPVKGRIWINSCDGSNWTGWSILATTIEAPITIKSDLGITPIFLTPKVVVTNGNTFTISGGLKLTKPLVEGTVVMALPNGIVPKSPYHIFFNSWNYDIPHNCRLWVDTDGNIKIYGASQFPTQEIDLDFSRTVTF